MTYSIKKIDTTDGQDVQVFIGGKLVMQCTYLGESNREILALANAHMAAQRKAAVEAYEATKLNMGDKS